MQVRTSQPRVQRAKSNNIRTLAFGRAQAAIYLSFSPVIVLSWSFEIYLAARRTLIPAAPDFRYSPLAPIARPLLPLLPH